MKLPPLGLLAAVALLSGCGDQKKVDPLERADAAAGLEHKTDEFVEKSDADLRQHMAQWARDGWNVQSISSRLVQADGTVLRRAELSREKK
ncbi:MAG TPA: hypothetical protein VNU68_04990 [Verrucomicrobiae bacterium]|nr:hypothetical protein [Verrucomicrobiae bacterium]